jgi:hypothetical protein
MTENIKLLTKLFENLSYLRKAISDATELASLHGNLDLLQYLTRSIEPVGDL